MLMVTHKLQMLPFLFCVDPICEFYDPLLPQLQVLSPDVERVYIFNNCLEDSAREEACSPTYRVSAWNWKGRRETLCASHRHPTRTAGKEGKEEINEHSTCSSGTVRLLGVVTPWSLADHLGEAHTAQGANQQRATHRRLEQYHAHELWPRAAFSHLEACLHVEALWEAPTYGAGKYRL